MDSTQFYQHAIGEYIFLQGNDITALAQDYLQLVISTIRSANMMIIYGVVLFFGIDWRIALVIILTSIFAIMLPRLIGQALTKARGIYQQQMAEYVTVITNFLEGFHIINQQTIKHICARHEEVLQETARKRFVYGKRKSIVLGTSELMTKAIKVLTFATIAILFYKKEISIGTGVATLSYVSSL